MYASQTIARWVAMGEVNAAKQSTQNIVAQFLSCISYCNYTTTSESHSNKSYCNDSPVSIYKDSLVILHAQIGASWG